MISLTYYKIRSLPLSTHVIMQCQYNKINTKLSNLQVSKLKTAVKNNAGKTLRIVTKLY